MPSYFSLPRKLVLTLFFPWALIACDGLDGGDDDDRDPDGFSFVDEFDAPLAEYVESNEFEVSGINVSADIRIENEDPNADGQGQYSINGGEWTSEDGQVEEEDEVRVRVFSADSINTEVETTLFIGDTEDTFTVRTLDVTLNAQDEFKGLTFTWPLVEGADFYRLLEDLSGTEDEFTEVVQLAEDVTEYRLDIAVHRFPWLSAIYELETCTQVECSFTDEISVASLMRRTIGYFKAVNTQNDDRFGVVAISADGETLAVGAPGEDGASKGFNGDVGDNSQSGAGAVYIFVKDGDEWGFQAYVKASNTDAADGFGTSVALSGDGNTLVVGAPFEDSGAVGVGGDENDNALEDSGAVYVFRREGTNWSQQAYLKASNPGINDNFGHRVAISSFGSSIAVSAIAEDGSANTVNGVDDDLAANAGAVYTFVQADAQWQTGAYIKASNAQAQDAFGESLALNADGTLLVVGAPAEQSNSRTINSGQDNNASDDAGAAYVYVRSGASWSFSTYLKATNTLADQFFGTSVAIAQDGTTIAVGARGEDSSAIGINSDQNDIEFSNSGAAYVFVRNDGNAWVQQAYVKSSNGDVDDFFGSAVALNTDGDVLVVGAVGEDSVAEGIDGTELDNSRTNAGAVYVFERNNGIWSQLSYVKAPNTDREDAFGAYLSLDASGNTLAVGAPNEDSESNGIGGTQTNNEQNDAGAVYLY